MTKEKRSRRPRAGLKVYRTKTFTFSDGFVRKVFGRQFSRYINNKTVQSIISDNYLVYFRPRARRSRVTDETQKEVFILFYFLTAVPRGTPGPPNFEVRRRLRVIRALSRCTLIDFITLDLHVSGVCTVPWASVHVCARVGTFFNEFCELDRRHRRRLWQTGEMRKTYVQFPLLK